MGASFRDDPIPPLGLKGRVHVTSDMVTPSTLSCHLKCSSSSAFDPNLYHQRKAFQLVGETHHCSSSFLSVTPSLKERPLCSAMLYKASLSLVVYVPYQSTPLPTQRNLLSPLPLSKLHCSIVLSPICQTTLLVCHHHMCL
jgi:hypothetical protein